MSRQVLARTVHVSRDGHEVVTLLAGSEVPAELAEFVTNPRAYVDADEAAVKAPAAEQAAGSNSEEEEEGGTGDGYDDLDYPALKAILKERELPQDGKTADLIARLREDDAEQAAGSNSEE